MATQFEIDCALMAGGAYLSNRSEKNKFPVPQGWIPVPGSHVEGSMGFEAVSFRRGTEIVISFAGTNFDPLSTDGLGDIAADLTLALGQTSEQLVQAARYYLDIKAANAGAVISFTGHSLGGGLAALMAVLFDEPAVTFDQAPFAASVTVNTQQELIDALENAGYTPAQLQALAPELLDFQGSARAGNVTNLFVDGELLHTGFIAALFPSQSFLGTQAAVRQGGGDTVSATDLHSQALLTAFLQSDGFRQSAYQLPDLLKRGDSPADVAWRVAA